MRLCIASDVHLEHRLEFDKNRLEFDRFFGSPNFEKSVLILAGDIGHPSKDEYVSFLRRCKEKFEHVVLVPGNHEYYAEDEICLPIPASKIESRLEEIAADLGIHYLNRSACTLRIDDESVTFLGCTLWSEIPQERFGLVKNGLSDFIRIYIGNGQFLTPSIYNQWHHRDVKWLTEEIDRRSDEKIVVVTHHLPTYRVVHSTHENHPMNCCFATDLEYLFRSGVELWVCGHSHKPNSTIVNQRRCLLNPVGYPGENRNFDISTVSI
jgi:predicted phosphodiesterase